MAEKYIPPPPYSQDSMAASAPYPEGPSAPFMASPPTTHHITSVRVNPTSLLAPGACPVCRNPSWTGTYSCLAWLLCFFCFWNCGLCCCLCMRKKKCTKCGFVVN